MPLNSTEGENVLLYRTNVLTKNANFKKILFFTKPRKHFCSGWNFVEKKPIFLIMRPWFSFWACASSFSQESFLFSAVLGS
jgi:hypothetical protein